MKTRGTIVPMVQFMECLTILLRESEKGGRKEKSEEK
jgi:hypothetical protein